MPIEAVTFDFWNTLIHDTAQAGRSLRIEAWQGLLEDAGFAVEREQLDASFAASWESFLRAWERNEQYRSTEAAVEILEGLGFDLPAGVHEALVDTFTHAGLHADVVPCDHVAEVLGSLRARGLRLGIICDVGMTPSRVLRQYLERHGLLDSFDHWSFSDEVGHYKPSPRIFRHALEGLKVTEPGRALHVGDLRRTDVAGALGYGAHSVRYTAVFDDHEFDGVDTPHVIDDHRSLLELIRDLDT